MPQESVFRQKIGLPEVDWTVASTTNDPIGGTPTEGHAKRQSCIIQ